MKQEFIVDSVSGLTPVAESIISLSSDFPVILFIGEMGTGKTTLSKVIMQQLGLEETRSPTFSLVNQYDTVYGSWYHFDLYRIEDEEELFDMGFEEYLSSGRPCLIEWPEIASGYIEAPYLRVELLLKGTQRVIRLLKVEA